MNFLRCDWIARQIAPCFLLLDNIETVLGTGHDDDSNPALDDNDSDQVLRPTAAKANPESRFRSRRTTHKAIDRILSTLLVEIDGLMRPSDHGDFRPVIVIATTNDISAIDRYRGSFHGLVSHFLRY